ncbi:MAG: hypothetical protein RI988_3427 [Pseudomonadota bacterium]
MNRYLVIIAFGIVIFALVVVGYYRVMFNIQRKRAEASAAEVVETRRALDAANAYTEKTVVIREKGNVATVRIKEAPGAETPVPDGILSAWRSGIDGLRHPGGKDADPAGVQAAVPRAGG